MSNELIKQVDTMKRGIQQEIHAFESEFAELSQSSSWLINADFAEDFPELTLEESAQKCRLLQLPLSISSSQTQLNRAYSFIRAYTRGLIPTQCPNCFIYHLKDDSLMVEKPVNADDSLGRRLFECPDCNHVLRVDPSLNI